MGQDLLGKQAAAREHCDALELRHPDRDEGKRIIVHDDICTICLQFNEAPRRLHKKG